MFRFLVLKVKKVCKSTTIFSFASLCRVSLYIDENGYVIVGVILRRANGGIWGFLV